MRRVFWLSLMPVLVMQLPFCYGLEWKKLHEQADKITLQEALSPLKEGGGSADELYLLGLVYLNLHKDKEAGEVFNKILRLKPDVIEAAWGIAEVERRAHNLEKSKSLLFDVIKDNPDFSPAYITLAYIKYVEMDFKGSVSLAYKVIGQGRSKVDLSNYTRGYLLVGGGRGMLAHYGGLISKISHGTAVLRNLKKAEELQPGSAGVLFGLGSFYFLAPPLAGGDRSKARDYLERALKADLLFVDAYVRLAQYYKIEGDSARYKIYLDKASSIDPRNELLLDTRDNKCRFICAGSD